MMYFSSFTEYYFSYIFTGLKFIIQVFMFLSKSLTKGLLKANERSIYLELLLKTLLSLHENTINTFWSGLCMRIPSTHHDLVSTWEYHLHILIWYSFSFVSAWEYHLHILIWSLHENTICTSWSGTYLVLSLNENIIYTSWSGTHLVLSLNENIIYTSWSGTHLVLSLHWEHHKVVHKSSLHGIVTPFIFIMSFLEIFIFDQNHLVPFDQTFCKGFHSAL